MALNVLAYNMKRVMNIIGVGKLCEAIQAVMAKARSIFARIKLLLDDLRTSPATIWAAAVPFRREMSLDRSVPVT